MDWSDVKILACDYNEHNLFYLESLLIVCVCVCVCVCVYVCGINK